MGKRRRLRAVGAAEVRVDQVRGDQAEAGVKMIQRKRTTNQAAAEAAAGVAVEVVEARGAPPGEVAVGAAECLLHVFLVTGSYYWLCAKVTEENTARTSSL